MWKLAETNPQGESAVPPGTTNAPPASTHANSPSMVAPLRASPRAVACISQGIKIKGEVTGSEDLFVDGLVDGKLNLTNGSLTIGPNGTVKADVTAREVLVRGKVEGKVTGRDKVQLWSTGQVIGEVQTERLAIEDGALLRGKIEAGKQPYKTAETESSVMSTSGKPAELLSCNSGTAAD